LTTASDEFFVPLFRAEREAHDCEDEAAWWKASRFLKEDRGFSFATSADQSKEESARTFWQSSGACAQGWATRTMMLATGCP
jgi:hypothetical protein